MATASATTAILTLVSNMVFNTPSVKAATLAVTTVLAACPAATEIAALVVEPIKAGGTVARAAPSKSKKAPKPQGRVRPRAINRCRSRSRACSKRLLSTLAGHPICCAASSRVNPSKQQSTTGSRSFFGKRFNSLSKMVCASCTVICARGGATGVAAARRSRFRRSPAIALVFKARRYAMP